MAGGVDPAVLAAAAAQFAAAIEAEIIPAAPGLADRTDLPALRKVWRDKGMQDAATVIRAAAPGSLGVVEHAYRMSGGGYHVRNPGAHVESVYPLADWIAQEQTHGTVYRRTVLVLEDWAEVPRGSGDRG